MMKPASSSWRRRRYASARRRRCPSWRRICRRSRPTGNPSSVTTRWFKPSSPASPTRLLSPRSRRKRPQKRHVSRRVGTRHRTNSVAARLSGTVEGPRRFAMRRLGFSVAFRRGRC
ncbi:unnamed protein product, partial [Durusdinium trenchii]